MKKVILLSATFLFAHFCFSQQKTILFVLSAADTLELNDGKKMRQTGVFLNEFYQAYKAVTDAGFLVDFSTPNGVASTIDNESKHDSYWKNELESKKEALHFIEDNQQFKNPIPLEAAIEKKNRYAGLIIPGGQGLMVDLAYDENIPILLRHFADEQKPTGLICHAPSLLLTLRKDNNPYLGYKVNAVSPFEEFVIENFIMKGKPENRKIAKKLKKTGFKYKSGPPKANFAVRDRNLVTSQNPYSGDAFNSLFLEALTEYQKKYGANLE
ncbi:MAG TPA: DJ-1/PfpI family protein [Cyclobacteriaceae bacterium]|nr:DJ-1/PfpI family protein [Cyclobacteriaceae bacterium]